MKKNIFKITTILGALVLSTTTSFAQLQLPQPSPKAKVTQTAGLTDITVDYSSPAVKGRTIWGDVVPYDEVWRTGANKATAITFSTEVVVKTENVINGDLIAKDVTVPAGTYSFFAIPGKVMWTLILNKNTELWGSDDYNKEQDIVRTTVKAESISNRERLTYIVSNFNDNEASIDLEWEKVRVSLKVSLPTKKLAAQNIDKTLGGTWRTYASAARYHLETTKDNDAALKYIDQSLALTQDWYNTWLKAEILAAKGNSKDAHALAVKAKELGDKNPDGFFYKEKVEKAIKDWAVVDPKKKK